MEPMNLRNVYVGRYKNSDKETLFYQKTLMQYVDLTQDGKTVYAREINLDSFISFQDAIPTEKDELGTSDIVKLYDSDRSQIISLNQVFIGDIYRVTDVVVPKTNITDSQLVNCRKSKLELGLFLIKQGALLINEGEFFKDMEHSIIIQRNHNPKEGELIVIEDYYFTARLSSDTGTENLQPFTCFVPMKVNQASKRKILEEYRRL